MLHQSTLVSFIIILLLHSTFSAENPLLTFFLATEKLMTQRSKFVSSLVDDARTILPKYDFIIVGGGTAGCVVANRLSENPDHTVLLLEAGSDESFYMEIPVFAPYLQLFGSYNWGHKSVPQNSACLGMTNKKCNLPRGKVLGGSSGINGMVLTRGNAKDFNRWSEMGNYGWSYKEVLPYFKKYENIHMPGFDTSYRGTNGPISVFTPIYRTPLVDSFLKSGIENGYNVLDYNGETQTGFHYVQSAIMNGTRMSANKAYIMPIKHRSNLHVKKYAHVTKILIDPVQKHAYGVEFDTDYQKVRVLAKKEVVLSAGAFGTPQLLMLSGIGPAEHLSTLNIPVIQDLKVGHNLQDHVGTGGLIFVIDDKITTKFHRFVPKIMSLMTEFAMKQKGPLTSTGIEALGFVNTKYNNDTSYPDMELQFFSISLGSDPTLPICFGIDNKLYDNTYKPLEKLDAFSIFPMILRPKSTGRILLKSKNPYNLPYIIPNYLTEPEDLEILLEGTKIAIEIAKSRAFKKYGTRLYDVPIPACKSYGFNTDNYWRCAIRHITLTGYHQCGTAKMGPYSDPDAVVDPQLKVYGVSGLRVIDASIMPFVPSAHTMSPVYMIAEKGADLIKSSWREFKKVRI